MRDMYVAGVLAGAVGAVVQGIYSLLTKALHLTDRTFIEFGKVFLMARNFKGTMANIVGILVLFGISSIFGVLFAMIIRLFSNQFYYIKGITFGIAIWLFLGVSGTIFKLELFHGIPPAQSLIVFAGSLVYGLVLSVVLKILMPDLGQRAAIDRLS